MAEELLSPPRRYLLHEILKDVIGNDNVYFQAPPNTGMQYPCILYKRDRKITLHADNLPWRQVKGYQVTVIDPDPDSDIPDKVADLPLCEFDRNYVAENLNHDVFNLFF